jgi:hypothetical protein
MARRRALEGVLAAAALVAAAAIILSSSGATIRAVCQWCVASALVMAALACLAVTREMRC